LPAETTNPDAEAKVLAAAQTKQPPAIPTAPAQVDLAHARTIDVTKLQAALAAVKTANDAIETCGGVTGDLRVAVSGLTTATKYRNIALGKLPAAATKA
jgi:hypothetical protein